MNIYVSMTLTIIFHEHLCVNVDVGLFDDVEKLTQCYFDCFCSSRPTIRCMVGLEGLLRCKIVLNEVKYGDQVCTEGHDSPEQKLTSWSPVLSNAHHRN